MLDTEKAFSSIRRQKPELVVLAVEPSRVPALAVEHRVYLPEGPRPVPVIVISESLRLEAELLHVFDFIPKPIDLDRLLDGIAAIGSRRGCGPPPRDIDDATLSKISEHIRSCTGLHFEQRNRSGLARGLSKRMSALHLEDHAQYFAYLKRHGEDRHELQKLLQFLTVGETYFFRYPSHFDALRHRFQKKPPAKDERIRIWSAGCSTGEEPYSIAIALMEAFPDWKQRDLKVIATDINNRSLKQARDGVYSPWAMRIAQPEQVARYFKQVGQSFLVREEVKRLVEFSHLNLLAPCNERVCAELHDLDAVFCRNVLIYFTPETAERLVQRFTQALKPSGQLFLGHAEAVLQQSDELEIRRHGKSFYYRRRSTLRGSAGRRRTAGLAAEPPLPPPPSAPQAGADPKKIEEKAPSLLPLEAALASPAANAAGEDTERARQLFDQEDFDPAVEILERVLGRNPHDTAALVLKGFILAGKGRLDEALAACDCALALNDLLAEGYFLKGVILDARDRTAEAAEEYRKALLLDHGFIMARYHMGRLHLRVGRLAEGVREIRNSIRLLSRCDDQAVVPFSGGLTPAVCMLQLQNALARIGPASATMDEVPR